LCKNKLSFRLLFLFILHYFFTKEKENNKRELVLLVEEADTAAAEALNPLAQRNAINAALKTALNLAAVVASVRLTARKNLLLTTTERFSADFLLQHTDA
jgi:predicted ATP-dependent endonuclease of OLD family